MKLWKNKTITQGKNRRETKVLDSFSVLGV